MAVSRSRRSIAETFVLILLAIAGLSAIDGFLAGRERFESYREAAGLFADGERLERAGSYSQAIDRFRAALSIRGEQEDYAVALAGALLKAGRLQDAESVLSEVLQRDSINGEANLMMARVFVKQGKIARAESYYHHAIYDQWRENAVRHRVQARLELIELLAHYNKKKQLLSELLALENEAGADINTLKHIAHLYIAAGWPSQAAEAFREILHSEARNADAYGGLGEAEFISGDYETAQQDFQSAVRFDPRNPRFQARLELCRQILQLDPTRRGLSMHDRYRRSVELLTLALDNLRQCSAAPSSPSLQSLLDTAREKLRRQVRPSQESDAMEANVGLAEKLWRVRRTECKQAITPAEQPLDLVLARISK